MVCSPASNSLNPPNLGPAPNIGFGPVFAPPQIPFPDISLPDGIPEDILDLLQDIFMKIPGGTLSPNADDAFRTVFSAVASLMNQLGPYLALYNMFQALLEILICIIDVLCALLNPFATIAAITRLFKRCIPNFLSIFPFLALVAMILAFILLLIALIEFLINYVISLINEIIANIENLAEAFQVGNEEGVLAITQKIASVLCILEQAFALLIAFQALFVIIEALAKLAGRKPCRRGKDDCCSDEFCPPFLADSGGSISGTAGRIIYHNTINRDLSGTGLPSYFTIDPFRAETWQFVDDGSAPYQFKDIITPINGATYWPEPNSYSATDNIIITVPYTVDMRMFIDPSIFDNNIADTTARYIQIKDAIVSIKPYIGVYNQANNLDYGTSLGGTSFGNSDGTFQLVGGLAYEDDGVTPVVNIFGGWLNLNSLIYNTPTTAVSLPATEDAVQISNISYTWKPNYKALFKYQLITAGCSPEVAAEALVIDQSIDDTDLLTKLGGGDGADGNGGIMPNIAGTLDCLNSSINKFRDDISLESAAVFQGEVLACLNDLKDQSEDIFKNAFVAGESQYESEVTLDPEIQFVDQPIIVSVNVKDPGGNDIAFNIPENVRAELAEQIEGFVTFGNISDFSYDGYQYFTANITSSAVGSGELTVSLNGNLISDILNRDNDDVSTSIEVRTLPYQFVGVFTDGEVADDTIVRHDETDVAYSE